MEIARINREYDSKIDRVRNNFFMFRFEKQRQIHWLQEQRQQEIITNYPIKHLSQPKYEVD